MSDIAKRLRASVRFDAIDGTPFERSVCAKQMIEAARMIEGLETKLAAAEDELAKHRTATEYYADGSLWVRRRYSPARLAWELEHTAMGNGHYGNALRIAKDLPEVTAEDRSLLDRYATGKQGGTDHVALQELAMRIDAGDIEVARGEE